MNPELHARELISDTMTEHYPVFDERGHINGTVPGRGSWSCWCDWVVDATFEECVTHASAKIDEALGGLTREYAIRNHVYDDTAMLGDLDDLIGEVDLFSADHRIEERWVSGWSEA
ncbi:hypothetical protein IGNATIUSPATJAC_61 [Mycobacterium phage IgnatiusPatJac]|nr:hypothetical protein IGNATIUSPATJAC_61 [Mycobacterium phage IgnatiusPatJac]